MKLEKYLNDNKLMKDFLYHYNAENLYFLKSENSSFSFIGCNESPKCEDCPLIDNCDLQDIGDNTIDFATYIERFNQILSDAKQKYPEEFI